MTESEETVEKEKSPVNDVSDTETTEPSEMEELKVELEAQKKIAQDAKDQYLRTLAEHENYKKRTQKDKTEQIKYANEGLIKETLPVIDNLERAISHSKETSDFKTMLEGVTLVKKQLLNVLDKFGVRPIKSLNQAFDPQYHQSVGMAEVEADAEIEENHVIEEAQKGYLLNERLLRPSFVILAKKKQVSTETTDDSAAAS
ncbi:Heat shock protein GrpE [hydrothermal vent metagenome]|uniref:Heat shock protein GrpE n=1 Tax=hydrothermal vent metagenome TaxID=652676 RepID=A0A3B1D908_9ZZZZ